MNKDNSNMGGASGAIPPHPYHSKQGFLGQTHTVCRVCLFPTDDLFRDSIKGDLCRPCFTMDPPTNIHLPAPDGW